MAKARRLDVKLQHLRLLHGEPVTLPAAVDFLMEILAGEDAAALRTLSALAVHRHNPAVRVRVAAVVDGRGAVFRKAFEKAFGASDQPPK